MTGVTILGLFLTPVFYVTIRAIVIRLFGGQKRSTMTPETLAEPPGM
jgi:hypothetical protein